MKVVDRIVTALMAFAVIPVAIFTPVVHWIYQITVVGLAETFNIKFSNIQGDQGWTEDDVSIKWIYDRIVNMKLDLSKIGSGTNEKVNAVLPYLKVAAVFFAIAVVIAFVIGVISIFTNAKRTQIGFSLGGIASLIVSIICFDKFAAPVISGEITIGSLFDIPFLSYITKMGSLDLSTAWFLSLGLFIAIIVWNLAYMLTLPEEEAAKYKRKGKKI